VSGRSWLARLSCRTCSCGWIPPASSRSNSSRRRCSVQRAQLRDRYWVRSPQPPQACQGMSGRVQEPQSGRVRVPLAYQPDVAAAAAARPQLGARVATRLSGECGDSAWGRTCADRAGHRRDRPTRPTQRAGRRPDADRTTSSAVQTDLLIRRVSDQTLGTQRPCPRPHDRLHRTPLTLRPVLPAATNVPDNDLDQRTREGRNELNDRLKKLTHKG